MKAFLSSTFTDLKEYRCTATEALERLGQQVGRMEVFGAQPSEPTAASLSGVDDCDLFVGVYAHRYGFIPLGSDTSITEQEFAHARKCGKPIFCFLLDEDHPWPPRLIEAEPGRSKLLAFKQRINEVRVRETFTTPEDLAFKVAASVGHYLARPVEVAVRLVTDYASPDVLEALLLYSRRIPAEEQFEAEDIVRWLREDQEHQQQSGVGARDYFFVATLLNEVCGFTLLHFHEDDQLAFVAYLVAKEGVSLRKGTITALLFEKVAHLFAHEQRLQKCDGFLLEVDDPRQAVSPRERRKRLARIVLFCTLAQQHGVTLRALDCDYRQPHLHVPAKDELGQEQHMLLMYASKVMPTSLPRNDIARLFGYIYNWLYPEGFSEHPEENMAYRAYLKEFCSLQMARMPESIRMLNVSQIKEITMKAL